MRVLFQDLRYAARLLVRSPGFSLLIILTLALGIGANAAIFSVVNGVLLNPLPYRQPDHLMSVYSQFPGLGFDRFWISPPEYIEFRERATRFEGVGAYTTTAVNLEGRDQPVRVQAAFVTASLFTVFGVSPERGRVFTAQEDLPNAGKTIVLSDGLWRRAFGADPDVVGRPVKVGGVDRTILGVMPPSFDLIGQHVEAWIPLAIDPAQPGGRGSHFLYLVGRLRPEATLAQARSELDGLLARWKQGLGAKDHAPSPDQHRLVIKPLLDDLVGDVRPKVLVLAFAVGLVLLIACLNVANLLLARAEARQREISIRTALGAQRRRLIRQFLTESVLLSVLGGVVGLLLAVVGVRAIVALNADSIPRVESIGVDGRVVAFTLALAVVTGLLFGLAPALHTRGGSFFAVLREGQRGTAGRVSQWFRRGLVVAEIALASLLVIGAGLLLKSFWVLQQVNPGFEPRNLLSMQVSLPRAAYPEDHQVTDFYRKLTTQAAALPGIESLAIVAGLPPKRDVNANDTEFESIKPSKEGPPQNVDYWQYVSRDYFKTMHIQTVAGRTFNAGDDRGTPGVVVINQAMAKVFWPTRNPIGDRVRVPSGPGGPQAPWLTIIGIVADVKQGGLDQKTGTELYFLQDQAAETSYGPARTMYLVARTQHDPMSQASALRETVRRLDPALPVAQVRPMDKVLFDSVGRPRFILVLVMLFAAVALVLAAVGTYGVLSYAVEQRTREIGVRMALGAQVGEVLRMILAQGARLSSLGLLLGVIGAVALRRVLSSLLFGVTPTDPVIFAAVVALLALVSFMACLFPAQRAARVDPLVALRSE